jgi:hypothetical protein
MDQLAARAPRITEDPAIAAGDDLDHSLSLLVGLRPIDVAKRIAQHPDTSAVNFFASLPMMPTWASSDPNTRWACAISRAPGFSIDQIFKGTFNLSDR